VIASWRGWIGVGSVVGLVLLAVIVTVPGLRHRALRLALGGGMGRYTVDDRLAEFGAAAQQRLAPRFAAAGVAWPPPRAVFVAFKDARRLECYAPGADGALRFLHAWPILAASGEAGPKLREGDGQVPEGIYAVSSLNPNSAFHVSLRVDYPNAADRAQGARDGRDRLGGDIMIHGGSVSIGCLAMGDPAAEELFTLAARCGLANLTVLIAPTDLRHHPPPPANQAWIAARYAALTTALAAMPAPP